MQLSADDYQNPDFEQLMPLDDTLSLACVPYYLAAQLLSGENENLAAWFMNRYRETFADLRDMVPAEFEAISTPYGGF
jgi:hypothetical protein